MKKRINRNELEFIGKFQTKDLDKLRIKRVKKTKVKKWS